MFKNICIGSANLSTNRQPIIKMNDLKMEATLQLPKDISLFYVKIVLIKTKKVFKLS